MNLYIDIGNTNIKINFVWHGKEQYFNYNTKEQNSVDTFYNILPQEIKEEKLKKVFICSVVPKIEEIVSGTIKKYFQVIPIFIRPPLKTGVRIKVNSPQSVGADLISLASFVNSISSKGIMVNVGTATTIIVVNEGSLEGVVIAPGLITSYESLISNASKISDIELIKDIDLYIGKTTKEAVSIGVLKGHSKMINGLVEDLDQGHDLHISGGHARKIAGFLPHFKFIKEATIEGIKVIKELNEK